GVLRAVAERPRQRLGVPSARRGGPLQGDHRGRSLARSSIPPVSRRQAAGRLREARLASGGPGRARVARGGAIEPGESVLAGGGIPEWRFARVLPRDRAMALA